MGIVIDAHSDILCDIYPRRQCGEKQVLKNYWVPRMRKSGIDTRVVAVFNDSQFLPELALRKGLDIISTLYSELDESPETVLCKSYYDIIKAKEENKIGLILGMEGAEPLGADVQLLRIFYTLGLRVLGFTHALRTYLADGSFLTPRKTGKIGGLTDVGLTFLDEAQRIGILIDVSHLNDPSFWDVIEYSMAPVVATHSNCRTLRDHPRNLTDDQIRAVADSGGVIGINACSLFVEAPDLEHLVRHIDHIVNIGGVEHAGIGPDFADYAVQHMSEVEKVRLQMEGIVPLKGLAGDEDVPKIAEELSKLGYRSKEIDLIMGENFLRVFKETLK
jgi:membrane dipeptidase